MEVMANYNVRADVPITDAKILREAGLITDEEYATYLDIKRKSIQAAIQQNNMYERENNPLYSDPNGPMGFGSK